MTLSNFTSRLVIGAVAWLALSATEAAAWPTIPPVYVATAEVQGIPPTLFYAIAIQESGQYDQEKGKLRPWPWSLNVAGKAYYYDSMETAWDALNSFVNEQPPHIGIGLVQVTWPFNQHLLLDPYTALEPSINLSIGAQILRACFDRLGDWWLAVGCYHSPTPARAVAYRERVRRHWQTLIEEKGTPS